MKSIRIRIQKEPTILFDLLFAGCIGYLIWFVSGLVINLFSFWSSE